MRQQLWLTWLNDFKFDDEIMWRHNLNTNIHSYYGSAWTSPFDEHFHLGVFWNLVFWFFGPVLAHISTKKSTKSAQVSKPVKVLNIAIGGWFLDGPDPDDVWNYPEAEMWVDSVTVWPLEYIIDESQTSCETSDKDRVY